jgi:hypothetical protein
LALITYKLIAKQRRARLIIKPVIILALRSIIDLALSAPFRFSIFKVGLFIKPGLGAPLSLIPHTLPRPCSLGL